MFIEMFPNRLEIHLDVRHCEVMGLLKKYKQKSHPYLNGKLHRAEYVSLDRCSLPCFVCIRYLAALNLTDIFTSLY